MYLVRLQYKLQESDPEWRPNHKLNVNTKEWERSDSVEYNLMAKMSVADQALPPKVITVCLPPETDSDWAAVKKGVYSCQFVTYRKWTNCQKQSWDLFFGGGSDSGHISPWAISSSLQVHPVAVPSTQVETLAPQLHLVSALPSHIPLTVPVHSHPTIATPANLVQCPEPFVCADGATASAWSLSKGVNTIASTAASSPPQAASSACIPAIGTTVCIVPDQQSQANDAVAGYDLPISFGRVLEVDQMSNPPAVKLLWLFSDSIEGAFSPWLKDGKEQIDSVPLSALQNEDESDEFLTVTFTKTFKLSAPSKVKILHLIGGDDSQ